MDLIVYHNNEFIEKIKENLSIYEGVVHFTFRKLQNGQYRIEFENGYAVTLWKDFLIGECCRGHRFNHMYFEDGVELSKEVKDCILAPMKINVHYNMLGINVRMEW